MAAKPATNQIIPGSDVRSEPERMDSPIGISNSRATTFNLPQNSLATGITDITGSRDLEAASVKSEVETPSMNVYVTVGLLVVVTVVSSRLLTMALARS